LAYSGTLFADRDARPNTGSSRQGDEHGHPPRFRAYASYVRVFIISVVLALVAVLVHYAHISVPLVSSSHVFDVLTVAYVVLLAGVLFRGI
jgi:hypothetical protein